MTSYTRDSYAAEVSKLRQENDMLRATVAYLREQLEPTAEVTTVDIFKRAFDLHQKRAALLAKLFSTRRTLSRETLHAAVWGDDTETMVKIVDVQLCLLRRGVEKHGIEIQTIPKLGLRLSETSRAKLHRVVSAELRK